MPKIAARARDIFSPLQSREYRFLWSAQVFSELGDWAARLALSLLVLERTGSATLTGLAVGASLVAWLGPGQLLTARLEHFSRRTVMVVADLVRAAAFLLMLLPVPTGALIGLAAVAGLMAPAFTGARSAALVEVTPKHLYGRGLALSGMTQDLALLAGYLLAGVAVAVSDPETALALNAVTFLVSAALISRLPRVAVERSETAQSAARAALRFLRTDLVTRRAALLTVVATTAAIAAETIVVVFSTDTLAAPPWAPAALLAGATVVTLGLTAAIDFSGTPQRLMRLAIILTGPPALVVIILASLGNIPALVSFLVVGCLAVAPIPCNVVAGPRIPREFRSVAMSILVGAFVGGQALGASLAGVMADLLSARGALVVLMLVPLAYAAWCYLRPLRIEPAS